MSSTPVTPSSPKPVLKGTLTVKISKCVDLEKKRLIGKMDPYVKLNVGGSEKFKTKVHDNGDQAPVWDQTFLFNLTGVECDLHLRVFDSELMSDSQIGRCDQPIVNLLANGGGAKTYDLFDPENFRKVTGKIEISVRFEGTGGPAEVAELAPIAGPFHFQHNMSGFLLHPLNHTAGAPLALKAGGLNSLENAFEFQGPYIRALGSQGGLYLTGAPDGTGLALQGGISDAAKFKWTGLGLQQATTGKIMRPENDATQMGTIMVLISGAAPSSGFSLVPCNAAAAVAPVAAAASAAAAAHPATNPHAGPDAAAMAAMSLGGANPWNCPHCTFRMMGAAATKSVCDVCHKTRSAAVVPPAAGPSAIATPGAATFDLNFPATWPDHAKIKAHAHPLTKTPKVYKGTYNCDVCKMQGQGIAYHCEACQWDCHPACVHQLMELAKH